METSLLIMKAIGALLVAAALWLAIKPSDLSAIWFILMMAVGIFLLAFPRRK